MTSDWAKIVAIIATLSFIGAMAVFVSPWCLLILLGVKYRISSCKCSRKDGAS